ncbi:hypothetical protein SAMN05443637_10435 [Pseudonocardia thermophila]|jgi:hypothetical protein|uniref:Transmembrane protein n=1 Tax=Pseudonocardia thermophila TaxID=1848 RepID=A0A1M6QVF5_PSETH|nr:hypothetical protein [Pseudonocardia thermophila]SHK24221.1 hypothetical protein SAMN05443637_10435 [Pseudonocardia thermophila]
MNGDNRPAGEPVPDELTALQEELRSAERAVVRRTDPGATALLVTGFMLVLLVGLMLPWVGYTPGWALLAGMENQGVLVRLFTFTALGFGLVISALALATRLWALAWLCAVGCGIASINGLWALWTRQVGVPVGEPGPAFGMVLAVIAIVLLAANWARIALRR